MNSYAILGTGAIGGYYGACLQRAGKEVHFLLNRDYHHVKKQGLVIESINGNFTLSQVKAYQDVQQMPTCDVIVVALKTTQNHLLPYLLPPLLKENSTILLLQNGLGVEEKIAEFANSQAIIGGLCFVCSNKTAPGHIRHLDYGYITIGAYNPNYQAAGITKEMEEIAKDFANAAIEIKFSQDLLKSRWQKLVWNIPYNGLSVVLDATTKQIMLEESSRCLVEKIMTEVAAGAKSEGKEITNDYIQTMLNYTKQMKPYHTSMKLDYDNHRPLEIEAIVGNPLKRAAHQGIILPKIEMLYQQLKFLDTANRPNVAY